MASCQAKLPRGHSDMKDQLKPIAGIWPVETVTGGGGQRMWGIRFWVSQGILSCDVMWCPFVTSQRGKFPELRLIFHTFLKGRASKMNHGLRLVSTHFHPCLLTSPPTACVSLQLPEEVPLQTRGQHPVPTPDPRCLRDPVLLCGRVDALQPGHQLPAEGQPRGKLHPAVSAPPSVILDLLAGNSLSR